METSKNTVNFLARAMEFINASNPIDVQKCYINRENGLYYCRKCHTAKQEFRAMTDGSIFKHNKKCDCEQAEFEAEERMLADIKRIEHISTLRHEGFPSCKCSNSQKNMHNWTFENDKGYNPEIMEKAKKFVENFNMLKNKGSGIIFYGTVGTGKSYVSACIANALIDREIPVLMTDFATIRNTLWGIQDKQGYYESLNKYPLLIIDDLGVQSDSKYMYEIEFNVINMRVNSGMPLIVTTNYSSEEIFKYQNISRQEHRILSRLKGVCVPIEVSGEDLRQKSNISDLAEMFRILG